MKKKKRVPKKKQKETNLNNNFASTVQIADIQFQSYCYICVYMQQPLCIITKWHVCNPSERKVPPKVPLVGPN